ncbi:MULTISPECIES: LysR family transcriptional regulator [Paraburkholderia]|jgi:DNA-binding transcriptional LysR family regulator|uniref:LysR family transcriptional regulator n=1 Tax=Paraburkholderia TaxID=1822464 RepID=UPI001CADBAD7|nr:LysR family transcriptional regulator [Paraburkholderia caribensis]CAG9256954.1 LysR family transcriptional regulator [Paraburkholderia caribensis]
MDLTALADFNAVAQHGGFAAAARKLDRPKATLSRRVAELEQSLGVRLIERGARTLRLTDEGRMLNEQTRGLLAEIAEAGETIASRASAPRGRLRVSAPIVYAHVALPRVASRFARAYPQVELEIVAEDRMTDPVEDGYDLVIRVNPNADELLVGRRVATDRRVLCAAPDSAIARECLDDVRRGLASPLPAVVLSSSSDQTWQIQAKDKKLYPVTPRPVLRLSSLLMVRKATLEGTGAALLPGLLVQSDIADGKLVPLGLDAGPPVEIWALYSSRRFLSAKVRAFIDMLDQAEATGA